MLLPTLTIQPGLYTESSDRTALNRWKDGVNVRFFKSNPEKVGGCAKLLAQTFLGTCRSLLAWTEISFARYIALGTNIKLYLCDKTAFYDITPLRDSGTLGTDPFATVNHSATVTVGQTGHGNTVGTYVHFSGASAVAGLTLNGDYVVALVPDADHYTITAASPANATTSGGGAAVAYQYEIAPGLADSVYGFGWGTGTWNQGTWGTPRAVTRLSLARIWSQDTWGEDLISAPIGAALYVWLASGGTGTRSALISAAPAANRWVLVSDQLRIAISFGSHDGSAPDPMLVRWCDSEDYTDWTPAVTNLAGDKRLDQGSEIIRALKTRNEMAIFTDNTIYSMTMTGDDVVFAFESRGEISRLVGPNAACDVNGVVYAMLIDRFITYDGTIKELPCDVHSKVFENINLTQGAKCYAEWNPVKSEVLFHFTSADATENDMVVGVSTVDGSWWLGDTAVARTAWLSHHPFNDTSKAPLATKATGYLMSQETGVDDDGAAIPYFLESYDAEIGASSNGLTGASTGEGEKVYRIKGLIPDFIRLVGRHTATLKGRKFPNDKQTVKPGIPFNTRVRHIDGHMRSRQIAVRIASGAVGADISIGGWRVNVEVEGTR